MKITLARTGPLALALLVAAPMFGCNKSDASDKKEESSDDEKKETKETKEKKKDTSKACKADAVIEVTNKYDKLPFKDGKLEVKVSRAYKDSDGFYELQLNNFEYPDRLIKKDDWKDDWVSVGINIYNKDKKKKLELVTYDKNNSEVRYIGPGISTKGAMLGFSGSDIGGVKIVHIDDEKICGELNLDDKYTKVKGNFIAKVIVPK